MFGGSLSADGDKTTESLCWHLMTLGPTGYSRQWATYLAAANVKLGPSAIHGNRISKKSTMDHYGRVDCPLIPSNVRYLGLDVADVIDDVDIGSSLMNDKLPVVVNIRAL